MEPRPKALTARQNAQAMVSAANAAHKLGDFELAEQMLRQAIEIEKTHADALQLLGLLLKRKGDRKGAEALMRQSLASDEKQPHVHHNLGNLLKDQGAYEAALDHYDRAVRLDPRYLDALIKQGELLSQLGRFADAEIALRKAYRLGPHTLAAAIALADFCTHTDKLPEAERILRAGLARHPEDPFLTHNLGLLLSLQQRFDEALPLLSSLVYPEQRHPDVFLNLGTCLRALGRLQEAANHYLKAIDLDPLNYHAHDGVNRLLWEMGRAADVGKSFIFAKQRLPDHPDLLEMYAECLIAFTRLDEAEAELQAAARLRPGAPGLYRLGTALRLAQGRPSDAIRTAEAGLDKTPDDLDLLRKLGEACLMDNRPDQALATARRMAELQPFNQHAAAYEATALRLLGRPDEARRLYDYERFIHIQDLAPPPGFGDLAAFNQRLAAGVEQLHHSQHEPVYQTLRNGTQTFQNLFDRPTIDGSVKALGALSLRIAAEFMAGLPDDPTHPFLGRKGRGMMWAGSWSIKLRDGGFHTDHIHPKGWISGVYYVETPACLDDADQKPGWIKFGEFQAGEGPRVDWEKVVRPRPGMLVLFPSYMWHGTLPISGDQPRLTIAFDIAPAF